nr:TPA_asm: NADH dehydrogenase subunit 3 [Pseudomyrmex gracilis]
MITIIIMMMILLMIPLALMVINLMLTKKSQSREKKSPFECGFDPLSVSRIPLSSQFFLIGLVFLVFDVEITMLLPLIILLNFYKTINTITIMTFFILILIMGLFFEYLEQSIEWKI